MRLVVRVLWLGIVSLALWISPVSAEELRECTQVKQLIRDKPIGQQLSKIKTELKQQIRAREREGKKYEGQADTACLIALYMFTGHDKSNAIDAKNVLDRYNAMERFLNKYTQDQLQNLIHDVLEYSKEATPQEKRDNYERAMFFLSTLIDETRDIADQQVVEGYPYNVITDKVWCGAPAAVRLRIDEKSDEIKSLSKTGVDWTALAESEFQELRFEAKKYYDQKYLKVCKAQQAVKKEMIVSLRLQYKAKAQQLTVSSWRTVLEGNPSNVKGQWEKIAWLNLPCDTPPSQAEIEIASRARNLAKTLKETEWHKDAARKTYNESGKLFVDVAAIGRKGNGKDCSVNAQTVKRDLKGKLESAHATHVTKVKSAIEEHRKNFIRIRDTERAQRLSHNKQHVATVTGTKSNCISLSSQIQQYITNAKKLEQMVKDKDKDKEGTSLESMLPIHKKTVGPNQQAFRKWIDECKYGNARQLIQKLDPVWKKVEKKMVEGIATLWVRPSTESELKQELKQLRAHCKLFEGRGRLFCAYLPSNESIRGLVGFLRAPEAQLGRDQLQALKIKYALVKRLRGHSQARGIQKLEGYISKKIDTHDRAIQKYWLRLFGESCGIDELMPETPEEASSLGTLSKHCSVPAREEVTQLKKMCRLQRLHKRSRAPATKEGSDPDAAFWIENEEQRVAQATGGESDGSESIETNTKSRIDAGTRTQTDVVPKNQTSDPKHFSLLGLTRSDISRANYGAVDEVKKDLMTFKPTQIERILRDRLSSCVFQSKIIKAVESPHDIHRYWFARVSKERIRMYVTGTLREQKMYDDIYKEMKKHHVLSPKAAGSGSSASSLKPFVASDKGNTSASTLPVTGPGEAYCNSRVKEYPGPDRRPLFTVIDKWGVETLAPEVVVRSPLARGNDVVHLSAFENSKGEVERLDCPLGGTKFYLSAVSGRMYELKIKEKGSDYWCYSKNINTKSDSSVPPMWLLRYSAHCDRRSNFESGTPASQNAASTPSVTQEKPWCATTIVTKRPEADCIANDGNAFPTFAKAQKFLLKPKQERSGSADDKSSQATDEGRNATCTAIIQKEVQIIFPETGKRLGHNKTKERYPPIITIIRIAEDKDGDFVNLCVKPPNEDAECLKSINKKQKFRVGDPLTLDHDVYKISVIDRKRHIVDLQPGSFRNTLAEAIGDESQGGIKTKTIERTQTMVTVQSRCNSS